MIKPQKDFVKNKHPHLMIPMKELGYPDGYVPYTFEKIYYGTYDYVPLIRIKYIENWVRNICCQMELPRPRIVAEGNILKELRMYKPKLPIIISEEPIFQRI